MTPRPPARTHLLRPFLRIICPLGKPGPVTRALALFAALLSLPSLARAAQPDVQRPKKIVLVAGSLDSHPRESHEYEKNIVLLKHCIESSPDFHNVTVETHFHGWPA